MFSLKKKKIQCSLIAFAVLVKVPKGAVTKSNFSSNLSLNFKSFTKIWESDKMYESLPSIERQIRYFTVTQNKENVREMLS